MIEETGKTILIAEKDMDCQASWFCNLYGFSEDDCETEDDKAAFRRAIEDDWKILKGQEYARITTLIFGVYETIRSRPDMQMVWEKLSIKNLAFKPK